MSAPGEFPVFPNTVLVSGEAIDSLHRWYVAAGLSPKPDGTYNKPSPERKNK